MVGWGASLTSSKSLMKLSSLRMRAISNLSLDAGTVVKSCLAVVALRNRVSMSAIGSVMFMGFLRSPARLGDARDFPAQRVRAEADAAEPELPHVGARAAALVAAVMKLNLMFRRPPPLRNLGCFRQSRTLSTP